ncbi:hypothetical protein AB0K60_13060 [Thermopolyspora sp. NPDC052614]|uniref:hypothetical protein n=1 Tax=Thermopolyspora sp. NPDC052614 TaxID=3155682 RepID=UPI003430AC01
MEEIVIAEEIVRYYRRFDENHQWLTWNSACWTIVKPVDHRPDLWEIATTLSRSGDDYEIVRLDVREGGLTLGKLVLFVEILDDGYFLLDPYDMYGSEDTVVRVLSERARVWSLSWVSPLMRLTHMEDREILVQSPNLHAYTRMYGTMPHLLDDELDFVWHLCEQDGTVPGVAEMMAVMELATGVRMNDDFVAGTGTALIIDDPIR